MSEDPLWDKAKVSDYIGVKIGTLDQWRARGVGPRGFRVEGAVRYRRSEVERWLAEQERSEADRRVSA